MNDLLIINPIPFSHPSIASYLKQIRALGTPDRPALATLALWCFSLFFDINYSKDYIEFYQSSGILMHVSDIVTHADLQATRLV